jgi:hypothetical protein
VRALVLIGLGLWLGAGTGAFAADDRETIRAADFKKVDVFTRSALFVAKDQRLSVLRTTQKGPPTAIFTTTKNGQLRRAVGVAETGDALFVSDGKAILRVTPAGESKTILKLDTLRADSLGKNFPARYEINWFLAAGPGDTLYFDLLPTGKAVRSYVCRYEPTSRRTEVLECRFPTGIDVDRERGILYVPPLSNSQSAAGIHVVLITSFSEGHSRRLPVSHTYDWCQLSPDGKTLLLSESATEHEPHVAILDLSSGRETVLPFPGSYVTWGAGGSIYFVRGDDSLWTATLGATQPSLLFEALGRSDSDAKGSFAEPPVLSRDGSWLAWRWAFRDASGRLRRGTVLIDLKNREYRLLNQSWHTFNWAQ